MEQSQHVALVTCRRDPQVKVSGSTARSAAERGISGTAL